MRTEVDLGLFETDVIDALSNVVNTALQRVWSGDSGRQWPTVLSHFSIPGREASAGTINKVILHRSRPAAGWVTGLRS